MGHYRRGYRLGITDIGETGSRVKGKIEVGGGNYHHGHLQTNKVKYIIERLLIHSLDRLSLVKELIKGLGSVSW